jgi:hypothetical protein
MNLEEIVRNPLGAVVLYIIVGTITLHIMRQVENKITEYRANKYAKWLWEQFDGKLERKKLKWFWRRG